MKKKILIKNGFVVCDDEILKRDILITQDKISEIKPHIKGDKYDKEIDARNKYILPGGIDIHTYAESEIEKNQITADNYNQLSKAALSGGITSLYSYIKNIKKEPLHTLLEKEKNKSKTGYTDNYFHMEIPAYQSHLEDQIKKCVHLKIKSFALDLRNLALDNSALIRIFPLLFKYNCIAFLHCEDGKILQSQKQELNKEKNTQLSFYNKFSEAFSEKLSLDRVIDLAEKFETKIFISPISSKEGLQSLINAKREGDIWIEACTAPQYLIFTDKIYRNEKSGYLNTCSPAYKKKIDNDALWEGLRKGFIKIVSSGHCPFTKNQKMQNKDNILKLPSGIPGIETLYPLLLNEGHKRHFKIQDIVKWISTNPARTFNLYPFKGIIRKNSCADLVIYNPEVKYKIKQQDIISNAGYSPYENYTINGRIETVIVNGQIAVFNDQFVLDL